MLSCSTFTKKDDDSEPQMELCSSSLSEGPCDLLLTGCDLLYFFMAILSYTRIVTAQKCSNRMHIFECYLNVYPFARTTVPSALALVFQVSISAHRTAQNAKVLILDIRFVTVSLWAFPIKHPAVVGDSVAERLRSFSTPALPGVLRAEGVCEAPGSTLHSSCCVSGKCWLWRSRRARGFGFCQGASRTWMWHAPSFSRSSFQREQ